MNVLFISCIFFNNYQLIDRRSKAKKYSFLKGGNIGGYIKKYIYCIQNSLIKSQKFSIYLKPHHTPIK